MQKRTLGKTGLSVTPLGFGGAEIGFLKTDRDKVSAMLNALLDAGMNVVDTAAGYQGSEEAIGESISHRRDQYVLISKCGHKLDDSDPLSWTEALILANVDRALKRLKTDHLDVMLLHGCDLATLEKGEALGALVKARNAGKIRFAGYSGDNETAAYAVNHPEVAVVECSVSITDQANILLVLPDARKKNIGILAKRPIANACWKDAKDQPGFYGGYAQVYQDRLKKMELTPEMLGFPGDPMKAWPEIALRFTFSMEGVSSMVVGTTNPEHVKRNIAILEKGPLEKPAIDKIQATFLNIKGSESWPGQG